MTDRPRWERILELFEEALELPPGERTLWLEQQDLSDPTILPEVEGLLNAHERADGILDRSIGPAVPTTDQPPELDGEQLAGLLDRALGGRYRIVRELGRGGMAVVFLAWERKHDRRVVLKVMRPEIAAHYSPDRFLREVRLAARLSHPHIVGLIDSGEADGLLYYVMPHVEGVSLRERLRQAAPLPLDEAVPLLRDMARALSHAHAAGVVHRDLKPANILVAGHHAYLLDFGVAKSFEADGGDDPLTRTGDAIGTPRYMAPEQLAGMADANHRVDIYAWGQLAHEMLTGTVRALSPGDLEGQDVGPEVSATLRLAREDISADLATLVGRCLEIRPSRRVSSAQEILDVIEGRKPGSDRSGTSDGQGSSKRSRMIFAGAAVAALAITPVFVWQASSSSEAVILDEPPVTSSSVLAGPIAVAVFKNETDDPSLDVVGRLAGDWISEGLVQTGVASVVPWPSSLEAAENLREARNEGASIDPVAALATATGAATIVAGSFYEVGDDLRFQAEVIDARDGSVVSAPEAISAPRDSIEVAIRELRDRLMGSIAIATDSRLASAAGLARRPPTFAAYKAFDRGLELYLAGEYTRAVPELFQAYELDPEFYDAPLLASTNLVNISTQEELERADSILTMLEPLRSGFTNLQDLRWQYLRARLDSDGSAALQAAIRASEITSGSRTSYNAAHAAIAVRRPRLAIEFLEAMDPDTGPLQGWAHYWTVLSHGYHLVGNFDAELSAARSLRTRFPDRRIGGVLEVRALASAGQLQEVDSLISGMDALSPSTYWSQGAAMVVAGEELRAHGHPVEGAEMLRRGREWLEARLRETPGFRQHRYWLGSAMYDLEDWPGSEEVFGGLAEEFPERNTYRALHALSVARTGDPISAARMLEEGFEYSLGDRTALLARIAAIEGDPARAVSLLSVAFQQGLDGAPWLHASAWPDLRLMRSDPRFEAVLSGEPE
jgi:serine/threonine protein kinase/tetratricopeptide (TPR) repeat protein